VLAVAVTSDAHTGIEPHRHTDDRERDGSHEPGAHLPSVTVCLARHPASTAVAVGSRVVDVAVIGVKRVLSVMESPAERVELSQDETMRCEPTRLSERDKPRSAGLRIFCRVGAGSAVSANTSAFRREIQPTRSGGESRRGYRSYSVRMSDSVLSPREFRAAAAAHADLGPGYSDAVLASWARDELG
jgi:hypothetical protein